MKLTEKWNAMKEQLAKNGYKFYAFFDFEYLINDSGNAFVYGHDSESGEFIVKEIMKKPQDITLSDFDTAIRECEMWFDEKWCSDFLYDICAGNSITMKVDYYKLLLINNSCIIDEIDCTETPIGEILGTEPDLNALLERIENSRKEQQNELQKINAETLAFNAHLQNRINEILDDLQKIEKICLKMPQLIGNDKDIHKQINEIGIFYNGGIGLNLMYNFNDIEQNILNTAWITLDIGKMGQTMTTKFGRYTGVEMLLNDFPRFKGEFYEKANALLDELEKK